MKDRRIRKTEQAIQAAFAKLLSGKSVEEITVKLLCETADINKSTFYLHYRDIYDCADQLRDTIVEDFCEIIIPYHFGELIENFSTVMDDLKDLCDKNKNVYNPFLKSPSLAFSSCKIKQMVIEKFLEAAKSNDGIETDETFRCSVSFVISGILSLLEQYEVTQINSKTILALAEKIQHGFSNEAKIH